MLNKLILHLKECSNLHVPPLNEVVNIEDYAKKIVDNAMIFNREINNKIIACVCAYFNKERNSVFITNVSVIKEFSSQGLVTTLLKECIDYAKKNDYSSIKLQVSYDNKKAIRLYEKLGFIIYETNNKTNEMINYLNKK